MMWYIYMSNKKSENFYRNYAIHKTGDKFTIPQTGK